MKTNQLKIIGLDLPTGTHFDLVVGIVFSTDGSRGSIQRGLHDSIGDVFLSVIGRGSFCFDKDNPVYPSYLAEKLNIPTVDAEAILDILEIQPGISGYERFLEL